MNIISFLLGGGAVYLYYHKHLKPPHVGRQAGAARGVRARSLRGSPASGALAVAAVDPITEAAYNVHPTRYSPAFGVDEYASGQDVITLE